ncbi:hypothetical protein ACE1B6_17720 [Aerosakkonemataceae cyanobacterium BLCC-F154]|uniref:Uncharacterized protein n=1 Tax=Floridaenema fluviatile BLCC-F154 TaxID=3153640 RepID=A0ABV4YE52_9CYAN
MIKAELEYQVTQEWIDKFKKSIALMDKDVLNLIRAGFVERLFVRWKCYLLNPPLQKSRKYICL